MKSVVTEIWVDLWRQVYARVMSNPERWLISIADLKMSINSVDRLQTMVDEQLREEP